MKLIQSSTIICRTGWCDECAKAKRPEGGNIFKVYGALGGAHMYQVEWKTRWAGFTPHIYVIHKIIGENVVYDYICGMYECGIVRVANNEEQCWDYIENEAKWKRGITDIKNWNALVQFKHDKDYFI